MRSCPLPLYIINPDLFRLLQRLLGLDSFDSQLISHLTSHISHLKNTKQKMNMLSSELIVDFPLKCNHAHVRFAKTAQLYIVPWHDDKNINELWYTEAEYNSMKRSIKQDALQVRAFAQLA